MKSLPLQGQDVRRENLEDGKAEFGLYLSPAVNKGFDHFWPSFLPMSALR